MSAGSGASNLGYGNNNPYNTSPYVNGTSSNYSGSLVAMKFLEHHQVLFLV